MTLDDFWSIIEAPSTFSITMPSRDRAQGVPALPG